MPPRSGGASLPWGILCHPLLSRWAVRGCRFASELSGPLRGSRSSPHRVRPALHPQRLRFLSSGNLMLADPDSTTSTYHLSRSQSCCLCSGLGVGTPQKAVVPRALLALGDAMCFPACTDVLLVSRVVDDAKLDWGHGEAGRWLVVVGDG